MGSKTTADERGIRSNGMQGPMSTDMFVETVLRNAWRTDNIRFMVNVFWGRQQGAPRGTITLVIGSVNDGIGYNIPTPNIPEYSIIETNPFAPNFDAIKLRGWRPLLQFLLTDHIIRPSTEILSLLGDEHYKQAVHSKSFRERVVVRGKTRDDVENSTKKRKTA